MKTVIVTADDFGLSREVNEAIEAAHCRGILRAASLMIGGPAAADAVSRARRLPSLRVGLHLTLVDGRPLLSPQAIPALVDRNGTLRTNLYAAGISIFFLPQARRQLAREVTAQFEAFQATGLPLDHVNAHKHFHVHPTVAGVVMDIGRRFGMRAVRVPAERVDLLAHIDRSQVRPEAGTPTSGAAARKGSRRPTANRGPWSASLRARLQRRGIFTSDYCFGEAWSGAMIEDRLAGLLTHLPAGVSEIYCHPATTNEFAGAAAGFRYAEELQALLSPRVAARVRDARIRLTSFTEMQAAA